MPPFGAAAVLAALALGLLLAACGPTAAGKPAPTASPAPTAAVAAPPAADSGRRTAPAEPTTVHVFDLQITSSAGNYIGAAKGYFREEGLQPEFIRGNSPEMMAMLAAGQIDVGAGVIGAGLYNAFARGISVKVVGDHGANLPNASAGGLVIRKDLVDSGAYQGLADLRGRKLSTTGPGSAVELIMDRLLTSAGMGLSDVEFVSLPFPDMLQAFDNKAIDAAWPQEPFTTIGVERGLIVRGPIGYDVYPEEQIGVVLFADKLLSDRALAVRYMRAYVRGVRDYVRAMLERDPAAFDEVVPILIEYTTVKDRALYEKAIPSGLKADPIPNVQSIVDDQEWYLARGYQTQRVNVRDYIDTTFVEQAIRELGPARR
jgi:NitT/TauT family transport system substrate-binding protein